MVTGENELVPPHNLDAEQSVLGAMLLERSAIEEARRAVVADAFYHVHLGRIFDAICAVAAQGDPVDLVTAAAELERRGWLEDCGGREYLMTLASAVPTARNVGNYAEVVMDRYARRQLMEAAAEITWMATGATEITDALSKAQSMVHGIAERHAVSDGPVHIGAGLYDVQSAMEARDAAARSGAQADGVGLPTGIASLDRITGGLLPGDLWVIGGRPSMGKTALATNIAAHISARVRPEVAAGGTREAVTLFVSLETRFRRIVERILCSEARVDSQAPRRGEMTVESWGSVSMAATRLFGAPIYIDDTPRQSAFDVAVSARRLQSRVGLDAIFVDYLGRMKFRSHGERHDLAVGEAVGELKSLGMELGVPVVLLVQISRASERRSSDPAKMKPLMSDLRDSGIIEADADVIACPWRPEYAAYRALRDEDEDSEPPQVEDAEILVLKNRDGPTGVAECAFSGPHRRFFDRAPKYRDEEATYGRTA